MANTLAEYYKSIGKPLPAWNSPERMQAAKQAGISNYTGTGSQNDALLAYLQKAPTAQPPVQQPATGLGSAEYTNRLLSSTPGVSVNAPQTQPVTEYFNPQTGAVNIPYTPSVTPVPPPTPTTTPTPVPKPTVSELTGGTVTGQGDAGGTKSIIGTGDNARATGIAQAKAELAPAQQAPTLNSVEQYKKLREEGQIGVDENELTAIRNEAALAKQALREFKQTSGATLSQGGFLAGISEAERNLSFRMENLAIREGTVISRLNAKNETINTLLQLGQQDYQASLNAYNSEYARNVKAVDLYNEQLNDQQKDAMSSATTMINLFKEKDVDVSQLDPSTRAQINQLELQANLPIGIFEGVFQSTPKEEKILAPISVENASGGKDVYFMTQGADGTPHTKQVVSLKGSGITGTDGVKPIKLSASQQEDIVIMANVEQLGQDVLTLGEQIGWSGVGGFYKGTVSQFVAKSFGVGSTEEQDLRSSIGQIKGAIAKLRGGTSFTANEQTLLETYVPTIDDNPLVIQSKINSLMSYIKNKRDLTISVAQGKIPTGPAENKNDAYFKSLGL